MVPTVCGASTVTVRGAVILLPKIAVAPAALGTPADQFAPTDQLPEASTFHAEIVVATSVVIVRSGRPASTPLLLERNRAKASLVPSDASSEAERTIICNGDPLFAASCAAAMKSGEDGNV